MRGWAQPLLAGWALVSDAFHVRSSSASQIRKSKKREGCLSMPNVIRREYAKYYIIDRIDDNILRCYAIYETVSNGFRVEFVRLGLLANSIQL
jgi:hypothetical protein